VRWGFVARVVALGLALLAGVYLGLMVGLQRRLLFPRPDAASAPARPTDAAQVWLMTGSGPVEAWYLAPLGAAAGPAPAVIFFHGNGELIDFLPEQFAELRAWRVGVLLVEFPGYGRSSGDPSEASIKTAALAAFDWARGQPTIDSKRIVAYGRSLGGAAAAILAAERPIAALVLESTFTSVRSFAHDFWVPELFVLDRFETLPKVAAYGGPVLVLHGVHDDIVPKRHAETLAAAAPGAELHFLRCGHNDCIRPWSTIRSFLARAGVGPPEI
jgi:fermentation-respiration switch protein FrsA (DUF1100 family)